MQLEPATLGLRVLEVKFRDGTDASRYITGARGPAAPEDTPPFESGSTPTAKQNRGIC